MVGRRLPQVLVATRAHPLGKLGNRGAGGVVGHRRRLGRWVGLHTDDPWLETDHRLHHVALGGPLHTVNLQDHFARSRFSHSTHLLVRMIRCQSAIH